MNDSKSIAVQGKASDLTTLVIMVPALLISLVYSLKKSMRARLVLVGMLGYFLYTYMSYTFLWMFNQLFLVYVAIMSLSLFAFILCMMSIDISRLPNMFKKETPVVVFGSFQLLLAALLAGMWMSKIVPSTIANTPPVGLEHYTTLVIQGMDLGFVVPVAVLSGILIMKKKPWGYALTSIVVVKGMALLTAITMMMINMAYNGVNINGIEIAVFSFLDLVIFGLLIVLIKCMKQDSESSIRSCFRNQ